MKKTLCTIAMVASVALVQNSVLAADLTLADGGNFAAAITTGQSRETVVVQTNFFGQGKPTANQTFYPSNGVCVGVAANTDSNNYSVQTGHMNGDRMFARSSSVGGSWGGTKSSSAVSGCGLTAGNISATGLTTGNGTNNFTQD